MSETSVLNELVGDGKKFATPEDLAKGKLESDAFIETLKTEMRDLRGLVTTLGTENEKIKGQLIFVQQLTKKPGDDNSGTKTGDPVTNQGKTLTEEDVSNLMIKRDASVKAEANKAQVDEVLIKKLGAEAKKFVSDQANALGVSVDELVKLAEKSPALFYRTVGIDPQAQGTGPLSGLKGGNHTINNSGTLGGDPEKHGSKWWEKKRTEVGAWKFATNKDLNIQMHRDMRTLGDDWTNY
jgi:hypothetical protein